MSKLGLGKAVTPIMDIRRNSNDQVEALLREEGLETERMLQRDKEIE
jgi:hypothetical protein